MAQRAHPSRRWLALPLLVALLFSVLAAPAIADVAAGELEGEKLVLAPEAGRIVAEPTAIGGQELLIWSTATAAGPVRTSVPARLEARVRGDQCAGAPRMTVRVDGTTVRSTEVRATAWATATSTAVIPAGDHRVSVSFTNDYRSSTCDRNLRVDRIRFVPTEPSPLAGRRLDVEPDSAAARQAADWRASRPADAAQIEKIATRPQATWFGAWSGDVRGAVADRVAGAASRTAIPVLVAYNVPGRDCGGYSAGGSASADAYRTWIRGFAAGLGDQPAVVVLEPDALAQLDCLSDPDRRTRIELLTDAIGVLTARPGALVYVDAAHSGWVAPDEMARRLKSVGAERARGFALNVSNLRSTPDEVARARAIAALLPGARAVIDTSRNGLGPAAAEWCNPAGRALGAPPGAAVADPVVDAYLWIKRPGESDGPCGGGPPAGTWWPAYALGLAQRAAG